MSLDSPLEHADLHDEVRMVSDEPRDGYVLDPWSGLYQETEATFHKRVQEAESVTV